MHHAPWTPKDILNKAAVDTEALPWSAAGVPFNVFEDSQEPFVATAWTKRREKEARLWRQYANAVLETRFQRACARQGVEDAEASLGIRARVRNCIHAVLLHETPEATVKYTRCTCSTVCARGALLSYTCHMQTLFRRRRDRDSPKAICVMAKGPVQDFKEYRRQEHLFPHQWPRSK